MGTPLFLLYGLSAPETRALLWPRRLVIAASIVLSMASAVAFMAQTAVMAGSITEGLKPASVGFMMTGTTLGPTFLIRAFIAAAAAVLLAVARPSRGIWIAITVAGLLAVASFAWTGHGAATEGGGHVIHLVAAIFHGWAAGVWLGALVALLILTLTTREGAPAADRTLYKALHGFSGVGTAAVAVLVFSGLINSWFMVGPDRLGGLITTPYGLLLTGKLSVFALMLVLAAANRFHLTPDLGNALDDPWDLSVALRRLKRSLVLETGLALALLAVVAVMGTLAPVAAMDMAT